MQLLKKIKLNYHSRVINDLVDQSNFNGLKSEFIKLYEKDVRIFFNLLKLNFLKISSIRENNNLFLKNFIFINSFLNDDQKIINKFLEFYFSKVGFNNFSSSNYNLALSETIMMIEDKKTELTFQNLIDDTINYQSILSYRYKKNYLFLNNQSAFFSTQKNFNFTDSSLTKCFFLIIDHPYQIYKKLKIDYPNKDFALNEMFNLDDRFEYFKNDKISMPIIKKDWCTHTSSWVDPNVISSLRGKVIKKNKLIENDPETYADIILHLRQSNIDIQLDYEVIYSFFDQNKNENRNESIDDISNNEKKFINKYVENIISDLDLEN